MIWKAFYEWLFSCTIVNPIYPSLQRHTLFPPHYLHGVTQCLANLSPRRTSRLLPPRASKYRYKDADISLPPSASTIMISHIVPTTLPDTWYCVAVPVLKSLVGSSPSASSAGWQAERKAYSVGGNQEFAMSWKVSRSLTMQFDIRLERLSELQGRITCKMDKVVIVEAPGYSRSCSLRSRKSGHRDRQALNYFHLCPYTWK
ncbi:hypothetical protein H4582DRAFT_1950910 [Lactarius indigo]|nr:hypothetical protein H4582DRAFT_1950910 [Lactarius indigo]